MYEERRRAEVEPEADRRDALPVVHDDEGVSALVDGDGDQAEQQDEAEGVPA